MTGKVRQVRPARWFHRGGQLRFTFDQVVLPAVAQFPEHPAQSAETQLINAESSTKTNVKVDEEGTAKVTESKARLLRPVLALVVATRSMDNDAGRHGSSASGGGEANIGGRTAGGFSGFGVLGSLAAQGSRTIGSVLGLYGLSWSVYSTIVSRGHEVEFKQNAPLDIQFGRRTPAVRDKVHQFTTLAGR
jgi:hypothetical protein